MLRLVRWEEPRVSRHDRAKRRAGESSFPRTCGYAAPRMTSRASSVSGTSPEFVGAAWTPAKFPR